MFSLEYFSYPILKESVLYKGRHSLVTGLSVESLHLEICHFVEKGLLKGNNIVLRATSRGNDRAWVFNVMESTRS